MSATAASVAQASPSARTPSREPWPARLLTAAVVAILAFLMVRGGRSFFETLQTHWPSLLFWAALLFVVNLFPITVDELRLTLDIPILLAVPFIYSGEVGATVALLGTFDSREVRREITVSHALYNRVQTALSALAAGSVFHFLAAGLEPWTTSLLAAGTALTLQYAVNGLLVYVYLASTGRLRTRLWTQRLSVGRPLQFLATYLGYGILAVVLAHLFERVGAWSVVTFLVPILVARQMLERGQKLQALTWRIQERERLLERALDRTVDERRDERLRIAGELHDEVLQALTKQWMLGSLVLERGSISGIDREDVAELVAVTDASMGSMRDIIHDLRRSPLGRGGLLPTLNSLVKDLKLDWKADIELKLPSTLVLDSELEIVVYQMTREALLNALKHARARTVRVLMLLADGWLVVEVEDDGCGFSLDSVDPTSHFGLGLMGERIKKVDGRLQIETEIGTGTRLTARFPLET